MEKKLNIVWILMGNQVLCCHVYVLSLFVVCLLVVQCGCHWSQLKATYLLTYLFGIMNGANQDDVQPCRTCRISLILYRLQSTLYYLILSKNSNGRSGNRDNLPDAHSKERDLIQQCCRDVKNVLVCHRSDDTR